MNKATGHRWYCHVTCTRHYSSGPAFPAASTSAHGPEPVRTKMPQYFNNRIVEAYADKSSTPISLKHLINFGKLGRNKTQADETDKLLKSGNFLRNELPTRLSHRLRDLQSLPYIVASNPHIAHVNELYFQAFESIRKFPHINTLEDNDNFCSFMQKTLNIHRVVIPELAIGISESDPNHLSPTDLDTFVTRMLRSRLSRRIITEQHIALTSQFRERQKGADTTNSERVGIVDTGLNPARVARQCADYIRKRSGPEAMVPIELEGDLESTFSYIEEHLEFLLFELLKNAARATVAKHGPEQAVNYPIKVTIVHRAKDLSVRVSDRGGGMEPWGGLGDPSDTLGLPGEAVTPLSAQRLDIFSFSHMRRAHLHHLAHQSSTSPGGDDQREFGVAALRSLGSFLGTVQEQLRSNEDLDTLDLINRTGIGLPLARMYAEYLGGDLQLFTIQGDGTDAYLTISKFGSVGKA